jgi:hypothetical protein
MSGQLLGKSLGNGKGSRAREEYVTISIPRQLYENAQRAIKGTGFRSVTEYAIFVLRESLLLKPGESVKERLRALGYVD